MTTSDFLFGQDRFEPFAVSSPDRDLKPLAWKRRYRKNCGPRCPFCNTGQGWRGITGDPQEILVTECPGCGATIVDNKPNHMELCAAALDEAWCLPKQFNAPCQKGDV